LETIRGARKSILGSLKVGPWWHISGCASVLSYHLFNLEVAHGVIKSGSGGAMILGLPCGSEQHHSAQEKFG
jgi:hypothetical protein